MISKHKIGIWYKENESKLKNDLNNSHIAFFKNLKKVGYRYFSIYKRNHTDEKIIKSFQQHYLPNNVSGKIDKKTFKIIQNHQ